MAATGPPPAPLQSVVLFILFLVVFSPAAQSHSPLRAAKFAGGDLSYEEVTTSLVVNQLAILQMMENVFNASCETEQAERLEALLRPPVQQAVQAVEAGLERRLQQAVQTVEAGLGRLEQAMQAVEAGQERRLEEAVHAVKDGFEGRLLQVLEAVTNQINTTTQDMLTRMAELRQGMDVFLTSRDPQEGPTSDEITPSLATIPQDVAEHSLCNGVKSIVGSVGSLEVVRDGEYEDYTDCTWDINFPVRAPVELSWEYFDLEDEITCNFDWVEVVDRTNEEIVYGQKLCGTKQNMSLMLTVLPPTRNILVKFHSDGSNAGRGFKLIYLQLDLTLTQHLL